MEIAVWIVTAFVALVLGGAGVSKLVRTKEKIVEDPPHGVGERLQPARPQTARAC